MFRAWPGRAAGRSVDSGPGDVFFEPEDARITRFDAQDAGVTFLAYFLLGPGQEAEISFPGD